MPEFIESTIDMSLKRISDIDLVLIGQEDCAPGHYYGPTVRPFNLIHFVTAGHGRLFIGNKEFLIGKGDVFFIPADSVSYYIASEEDPWHYSWAGFTGVRADRYMKQFMAAVDETYVHRGSDTGKYADIILPGALLKDPTIINYLKANSILLHLLSELVNDLHESAELRHVPSLAYKAKYLFDIKYAENIHISDIAEDLHVHPNYLTRTFREEFGISPKKYVMDLKLKKAANMLTSSDMSAALIGYSVGFEDQAAFSKAFKARFGMSPARWRAGDTSVLI